MSSPESSRQAPKRIWYLGVISGQSTIILNAEHYFFARVRAEVSRPYRKDTAVLSSSPVAEPMLPPASGAMPCMHGHYNHVNGLFSFFVNNSSSIENPCVHNGIGHESGTLQLQGQPHWMVSSILLGRDI